MGKTQIEAGCTANRGTKGIWVCAKFAPSLNHCCLSDLVKDLLLVQQKLGKNEFSYLNLKLLHKKVSRLIVHWKTYLEKVFLPVFENQMYLLGKGTCHHWDNSKAHFPSTSSSEDILALQEELLSSCRLGFWLLHLWARQHWAGDFTSVSLHVLFCDVENAQNHRGRVHIKWDSIQIHRRHP